MVEPQNLPQERQLTLVAQVSAEALPDHPLKIIASNVFAKPVWHPKHMIIVYTMKLPHEIFDHDRHQRKLTPTEIHEEKQIVRNQTTFDDTNHADTVPAVH